jgi:hypothetical protein
MFVGCQNKAGKSVKADVMQSSIFSDITFSDENKAGKSVEEDVMQITKFSDPVHSGCCCAIMRASCRITATGCTCLLSGVMHEP